MQTMVTTSSSQAKQDHEAVTQIRSHYPAMTVRDAARIVAGETDRSIAAVYRNFFKVQPGGIGTGRGARRGVPVGNSLVRTAKRAVDAINGLVAELEQRDEEVRQLRERIAKQQKVLARVRDLFGE